MGIFSHLKKRDACDRALSGAYVCKIRYLVKCPSFAVLKVENAIFHGISGDFCIYPICKIFRFGPFKKFSLVIFRILDEKLTQKHVARRPNP